MSMAVVLRAVRDELRAAYGWRADQCGVRIDGTPPASAGEWYAAVGELGIASESREHLREVYQLEVALWRRLGQHPDDRAGDALLEDEALPAPGLSLDALERLVVRRLHANYAGLLAAVNVGRGAGSPEGGDVHQLTLAYRGRGRSERWSPGPQASPGWLGRRLRFEGLLRVQAPDVAR